MTGTISRNIPIYAVACLFRQGALNLVQSCHETSFLNNVVLKSRWTLTPGVFVQGTTVCIVVIDLPD